MALTRGLRLCLSGAIAGAALASVAVASGASVRPSLVGPPSIMLGPADAAVAAAKKDSSCVLGRAGVCYVPAQLQAAYDFPSGLSGAGQTIVIVDAYDAPDITQDLASFDSRLGIPPPPNFAIYHQVAIVPGASGSGATFSWEVEISLDIEYAHAMAPGANIVLALARSDDSLDIAQVEREALPQYPSAIVSQSFGGDETGDPDFIAAVEPLYQAELASGGTVLASSGDFGATNGNADITASYPASDPMVLAVGGTMGRPYPEGLFKHDKRYGGEQAWNEPLFGVAGGGAPSVLFTAPAWQVGVTGQSMRAEPDISYNAAVNGGVVVVLSCPPNNDGTIGACDPNHPLAGVVGGTSAGSPQWAAIVALANESRGRQAKPQVGQVAPLLYAIAANKHAYDDDFYDVVAGDNVLVGSKLGFKARPGYDLATGLGTPDVSNLLGDLVAGPQGPTPPPPHPKPGHGGHGHADPGK